jgi:hypothetical protein
MRIPISCPAAVVALSTVALLLAAAQSQEVKPFTERVDVHRVLLDVHVTDGVGQPLEDLATTSFVVRIDGRPARVESATWMTGALRREAAGASPAGSPAPCRHSIPGCGSGSPSPTTSSACAPSSSTTF